MTKLNFFTKIFFYTIIYTVLSTSALAQFGPPSGLVKTEVYFSFDKLYAGGEVKAAVKAVIDESWHINSHTPNEDFLIPSELTIASDYGFELLNTYYPDGHEIELDFSDVPLSVYEGEVYFGALIGVPDTIAPGKYEIVITVSYQACDDNTCLPPDAAVDTVSVEVVGKTEPVNQINQNVFENIILSYTPADTDDGEDDSIMSSLEDSGIIIGLLLVFLGGLALNLTPCVYPLIPITISYFGGQSEGRTSRLALMGLFYLLGMALTYSVVGVVTALSGSVFGALLQNTYVIIGIIAIFIALALSMFGLYEVKMPDKLVAKAGGAKSGLFGAFFMGLTMGIVAAPCIGPFVLGLVTFVAAKGEVLSGFLYFFFLALGLGTPYFILAIFSGKIKKLPKAGEWMDAVKHIFGFLLLGMAVYFALPLIPDPVSSYILPAFMIIAGIIILFFDKSGNNIKGFRIFKIVFSFVLIGVAAYALVPTDSENVAWENYSDAKYEEALGSQPVIIDFYADWCIPCKELDAMTFSDPAVIGESERFVTLKADMTKTVSDEVERLRNEFSIVGVPTVLLINSNGEEVGRITGFVNAETFLAKLEKIE